MCVLLYYNLPLPSLVVTLPATFFLCLCPCLALPFSNSTPTLPFLAVALSYILWTETHAYVCNLGDTFALPLQDCCRRWDCPRLIPHPAPCLACMSLYTCPYLPMSLHACFGQGPRPSFAATCLLHTHKLYACMQLDLLHPLPLYNYALPYTCANTLLWSPSAPVYLLHCLLPASDQTFPLTPPFPLLPHLPAAPATPPPLYAPLLSSLHDPLRQDLLSLLSHSHISSLFLPIGLFGRTGHVACLPFFKTF